ncbi:hypothetical protein A9K97_gp358 [Tokyovirus A1]|uniref:hypothetical protein n=1 Tax=Tokyovirus A1 TaxID=1826170 RepID=UPI0007A96BB4|nr:hypothetical protein A9K97_gp358 [Tokyovirus A1]BAU79993.1 hypothetical protein [Tokyovirus A1]
MSSDSFLWMCLGEGEWWWTKLQTTKRQFEKVKEELEFCHNWVFDILSKGNAPENCYAFAECKEELSKERKSKGARMFYHNEVPYRFKITRKEPKEFRDNSLTKQEAFEVFTRPYDTYDFSLSVFWRCLLSLRHSSHKIFCEQNIYLFLLWSLKNLCFLCCSNFCFLASSQRVSSLQTSSFFWECAP